MVDISVIVCTRDRPDTIGQAIESIAQCDYPSFDIHIMDQSTTDATQKIIETLARQYRDRCAIVYHHLDKAGLSRAYNLGMKATEGEIMAFTDDDVIVPPDWLTQIREAMDADPKAGLLYGQVLVPESLKESVKQGIIVPALPIPRRERLGEGLGFKVFGMGANMAIRRSIIEKVGGFDEALGGGGPLRSSQDFDFAYRVFRAGYVILLEPLVKVDHYGTRTREQWPITMKNYGIGDGAFYWKHVRCGDVYALYCLLRQWATARARQWKLLLTRRKWFRDDYADHLRVGVRESSRFAIDREKRLYMETETARMEVTQANVVTAATRDAGIKQ
jgi:GT2 family glycosyltransferase